MRSTISCMLLCALATASFAHHSGAMFDQAKTVTLAGTVKEYQFTHPHVWIELMVPDAKGKPVAFDKNMLPQPVTAKPEKAEKPAPAKVEKKVEKAPEPAKVSKPAEPVKAVEPAKVEKAAPVPVAKVEKVEKPVAKPAEVVKIPEPVKVEKPAEPVKAEKPEAAQ